MALCVGASSGVFPLTTKIVVEMLRSRLPEPYRINEMNEFADQDLFIEFLRRADLVGPSERPEFSALAGGVSSDIWVVRAEAGVYCVKRALDKLKVEDDWHAPVERNTYEVAWMRRANEIAPGCTPEVLADEPDAGMFAMTYLDPAPHGLWKAALRDGTADVEFARRCGSVLGEIHRATFHDPEVADAFATDEIFHAIRLEPYLEATARRHADVADRLADLVRITAEEKHALVHGDVSPKNILIGDSGPVLLDAECAWYGDSAFDLAFCLNHLLLKCLWTPTAAAGFLDCFDGMHQAYVSAIGTEHGPDIERRTAHLLPGLFLGRVDGKSPVEYLTAEVDKDRVRRTAKRLLTNPVDCLKDVRS